MMEILFRGKRVDNGEWVYGLLCQYHEGISAKISLNDFGAFDIGMAYCVDPTTIGQYTGLNDKNGVKIFEEDIILVDGADKYSVEFKKERNGFFPFACGDGCGCCERDTVSLEYQSVEVIGNIHDTKETNQ